jgi:hypothetical protein
MPERWIGKPGRLCSNVKRWIHGRAEGNGGEMTFLVITILPRLDGPQSAVDTIVRLSTKVECVSGT